jgi:ankyrin repeat protein
MNNAFRFLTTTVCALVFIVFTATQAQGQIVNYDFKFLGIECINETSSQEGSELGYSLKMYLKDKVSKVSQPLFHQVMANPNDVFVLHTGEKISLAGFQNFDLDLTSKDIIVEGRIIKSYANGEKEFLDANKVEIGHSSRKAISLEVKGPKGDHFKFWYTFIEKERKSRNQSISSEQVEGEAVSKNVNKPISLAELISTPLYDNDQVSKLLADPQVKISAKAYTTAIEQQDKVLINRMLARDNKSLQGSHFSQAMDLDMKDIAIKILQTKRITPGERELIHAIDAGDYLLFVDMLDLYGGKPNVKVLNHALQVQSESSVLRLLQKVQPNSQSYVIAAQLNDELLYGHLTRKSRLPDNRSLKVAIDNDNPSILEKGLMSGGDANGALEYALSKKNHSAIIYLLSQPGVNVSKALPYAIERNDQALWDKLINDLNADPNEGLALAVAANKMNMAISCLETNRSAPTSHLAAAIQENHYGMLQKLLEYDADPNQGMGIAIRLNRVQMVETLLNNGAGANRDTYMEDAAADNLNLTKMLVNAGADPTAGMHQAALKNQFTTIEFLLQKGANPDAGMKGAVHANSLSIVKKLLAVGASAQGYIEVPAERGHLEMVKLLLTNGVSPDAGMPAAIRGNRRLVTAYLLDAGASSQGYISTASKNGNASIVKDLLEHGADPNEGIEMAVNYQHVGLVKMLISAGADVSNPDHMSFAVAKRNLLLIPVLAQGGCPVNQVFPDGGTLLHKTCTQQNALDLVTCLIKAGAPIDIQNNQGNTALHLAARKGKNWLPIVEALVLYGADVNLLNNSGETPLKVAKDLKVKKFLKSNGALKK